MAEILFLHGAADSADIWERQVAYFGRRHAVLALDLPGHGARLGERAFDSADENAEEAMRALEQQGFGQPVVVGHSMGGAIALTLALRWPAVPRALVLAGSGARLRMQPALIDEARQRAEAAAPGRVAPRIIPIGHVVAPGASEVAAAWLEARFGRSTPQAAYADFVATNGFDVMGRLHEVTQPTLVVGGEDDRWTPPRFQSYLAEHIPRARLVLFPQTGHYPFVERATEFNEELDSFLEDIGAD